MKVKVKEITLGCMPIRVEGDKSDCFDLVLAEEVTLKKGELYVAKLGVAMELPKGMIAKVYSRSSTPSKWNVQIAISCLLYTSPSPRDRQKSRMPSFA